MFMKRHLLPIPILLGLIELLLGLALLLWIVGWPVSDLLTSGGDFGLNNSASRFYYIIVIILVLLLMLFLLAAVIPSLHINRWLLTAAIGTGLLLLAILSNALFMTAHALGFGSCDDDDDCRGAKIAWGASFVLIVVTSAAIAFALYTLLSMLHYGLKRAHKTSKKRDRKVDRRGADAHV